MLKYFRYICLIILLITSFIGTDLLVKHLKMQDPIFISIKELENEYKKEPINAIIEDNYIIPGVNGIMLDVNYSYKKMKEKKSFLPSSLSLKEFNPDISIINNKDKIIKHANPYKKGVSLLTISDEIANYLDKEVIPYSILTTINNYNNNYKYGMQINNDYHHYKELDTILTKIKQNNKFCYYSNKLYDICLKNNKTIFTSSINLDANYLLEYKNITSGDIIFIDNNISIEGLAFVLTNIEFKGLQILPLSILLSESR